MVRRVVEQEDHDVEAAIPPFQGKAPLKRLDVGDVRLGLDANRPRRA